MDDRQVFIKKVNAITAFLFFIGLLVLIFFDWLPIWAAAMVSLFVAVTLRQFLIGKIIDVFVSLIIFGLLFVSNSFYYSEVWTGILLMVGSGYIFVRQCADIYAYRTKKTVQLEENAKHHYESFDDEDPEN